MKSERLKLRTRNINNKNLMSEIDAFVRESVLNLGIFWASSVHRESFLQVIEGYIDEFVAKGKIVQYNIICDARNNKDTDMDNGIYHLDIHYKQRNCLNITKLEYTINDNVSLR